MKYFGLALFLIVGIALLCLSYRLRKGDRGVLHEYHYRGIPEDRLLAFQRDIAAALLWMGLCILMIFTMAVRMHERYLYMAVTFFLIDFIKNEKRGSFILYVLTTLTLFHNIALLLDVSTLLYPLYTMPSYYYLLNSIYSGINLLALGFGLYYAATSIYDEYENKPKQVAAHIAVPVLPSAPLQP